jgi:hypothetical protein
VDPKSSSRRAILAALLLATAAAVSTASAEPAWEKLDESDGIAVFRREVPGSEVVAFRGDALIEAPLAKVASVIRDVSRSRDWVADLVEIRVVREVSSSERILYQRVKTPWPLDDRDFVCRETSEWKPAENTVVFHLRATEDAAAPAKSESVVRGEVIDCSFTLVGQGSRTRAVADVQVDPRGCVPKWAVNMVQRSWPRKTFEGLRRQAAKPDVQPLASFAVAQ